MKNYLALAVLALGLSFGACQSKAKKTTEKTSTECESGCKGCASECSDTKVAEKTAEAGVYYFHGDRKCKTCKSVGAQAKEVAAEMNVKFFDVNIDKEENKELAKTFQATGSSLMIMHAKSGKIEDLTNFAFLNAINSPQDYIEKLKSTLNSER